MQALPTSRLWATAGLKIEETTEKCLELQYE
jgi:hypothetical protein